MKHAKKMRFISDEEYQKLLNKSEVANDLESDEVSDSSSEYANLGDDQKWKLYQQTLHRMLDISELLSKKAIKVKFDNLAPDLTTPESKPDKELISPILAMFPRNQQEKASLIKQFLDKSRQIKWDENYGEVFINGNLIEGSHIANLISHMIKPINPKPVGLDIFIKSLSKLNIPSTLIGNTTVKNAITKERALEQNTSPKSPPKSLNSKKLVNQEASPPKGKVQASIQNGTGWKNKSKPVSKKVKSFRWQKFG